MNKPKKTIKQLEEIFGWKDNRYNGDDTLTPYKVKEQNHAE